MCWLLILPIRGINICVHWWYFLVSIITIITIIFAAALICNEKKDTYRWLLQQLKVAMNGKAPVSVITDDDLSMKFAIEKEFPNAHHRLCAWHLVHNTTSNIGKPQLTSMFKKCMLGDYEIDVFRQKWFEMVEGFGVWCTCTQTPHYFVQQQYQQVHWVVQVIPERVRVDPTRIVA
ncbi:hypothetical protein Ahy_B09g097280 [Arachis hypogaea]|uniref:MULE transposase domain-containing protein n=1 Tax=Arachis hypogaea TaxID=3818 RepID=A0A444XNZ3_ARAHY|nr:hypothetical protein Ahy_B09g097280 [Arachis hypogaea]